jgi:hypothetical protein
VTVTSTLPLIDSPLQTLEQDKAFLASKMESFSTSMQHVHRQSDDDTASVVETVDSLRQRQASLQRDLQDWMAKLSASQREAQERLVAEHSSHLEEVGL